jgi:hypothetical protein
MSGGLMRTLPRQAGLYFSAIMAVVTSIYFGIQYMAASAQAHIDAPRPRQMTKLDEMAQSAREIRRAIANANHTVEPLPPLTSKPASKFSQSRTQPEHRKSSERRLSIEARNAFASSYGRPPAAATAVYDRHSVH